MLLGKKCLPHVKESGDSRWITQKRIGTRISQNKNEAFVVSTIIILSGGEEQRFVASSAEVLRLGPQDGAAEAILEVCCGPLREIKWPLDTSEGVLLHRKLGVHAMVTRFLCPALHLDHTSPMNRYKHVGFPFIHRRLIFQLGDWLSPLDNCSPI